MSLLNFKKTVATAKPTRAQRDLTVHLQSIRNLHAIQNENARHVGEAETDIQAARTAAAAVKGISDDIDLRVADARYNRLPATDLTAQQRSLAVAKEHSERASAVARAAQIAKERYEELITDQRQDIATLKLKTTRLLWEVLVEKMTEKADDLAEAEAKLRALHREVYIAALAADEIALQNRYGEFQGSATFGELHISKPHHVAFGARDINPEEALRRRNLDYAAFQKESEALVYRLLNADE